MDERYWQIRDRVIARILKLTGDRYNELALQLMEDRPLTDLLNETVRNSKKGG